MDCLDFSPSSDLVQQHLLANETTSKEPEDDLTKLLCGDLGANIFLNLPDKKLQILYMCQKNIKEHCLEFCRSLSWTQVHQLVENIKELIFERDGIHLSIDLEPLQKKLKEQKKLRGIKKELGYFANTLAKKLSLLDSESLHHLEQEHESFPKGFKELFSLSLLYQELEEAEQTEDSFQKDLSLSHIAPRLAKKGQLKEALTLARSIANEELKSLAFLFIATFVLKNMKNPGLNSRTNA